MASRSTDIGSGHLHRCITLANHLQHHNVSLNNVSAEAVPEELAGGWPINDPYNLNYDVIVNDVLDTTTEEMALLGSLTKFGMGLLHGDGNTRQCMATAVVAYKQAFGFDAPPYTYADFEESDVIVLVGSNLCIAHPILWERISRNPNDPAIVVVTRSDGATRRIENPALPGR